ncbi:hypothetical protein [Maritalea myrionectae]|uniref:hypothetical protein n=1 Tax=Maritalea myrionectae TaxID=454601 RepID=UPI0012EB796A|nr:hypothetical protein [Maritalea myrionectae]
MSAQDQVSEMIAQYDVLAEKQAAEGDEVRAEKYRAISAALNEMMRELKELRDRLRPRVVSDDLGDLSDLPEELVNQLSSYRVDGLEQKIHDILAASEGEVSLDAIMVELFRRHGEVSQRRQLMNKIYRMVQKGMISSVAGKKGVYILGSVNDETRQETKGFSDDLDDLDDMDDIEL